MKESEQAKPSITEKEGKKGRGGPGANVMVLVKKKGAMAETKEERESEKTPKKGERETEMGKGGKKTSTKSVASNMSSKADDPPKKKVAKQLTPQKAKASAANEEKDDHIDDSEAAKGQRKRKRPSSQDRPSSGEATPALAEPTTYRGHIALSSFLGKDFELDTVHSLVQFLPSFSLSPFSSATTHLIVAENRRTYKVLVSIARGLWVLSFQWVLASLEAREWQREEKYETYKWFSGVKTSRENRMKGGKGILDGLSIFLNGRGMSLKEKELVELVEAADGKIAKNVKECDYCVSTLTATRPKKAIQVRGGGVAFFKIV